jgi:hypothetical protein
LEDTEDLIGKFYSTQQHPDESVASWGYRREDLLDRDLHDQLFPTQSMNDMLRTKFSNGLLPHLREPMRNKAEVIVDVGDLRMAARKIENEHPSMVRPCNETEKLIKLDYHECKSLLDAGSTVSTLSHNTY